jgi:hypothetical protein
VSALGLVWWWYGGAGEVGAAPAPPAAVPVSAAPVVHGNASAVYTLDGAAAAAPAPAAPVGAAAAADTTAWVAAAPVLGAGVSAVAIHTDLEMWRGEDKTFRFTLTPAADATGWTCQFGLRGPDGKDVPGFPRAAVLVTPATGVWEVAVAAADTAGIAATRYGWDLRRVDAGQRLTLGEGHLRLRREVTP